MTASVFQRYMDQRFGRAEGEAGVRNLENMLEAMGYGQGFMRNRALEEFFSDNSGAIEAVLMWIENEVEGVPEWEEGLEGELEYDEDEDEDLEDDEDEE